ncbi:hypothetical protein CONLIGDRAFT_183612 [Coniochaeta ligniaria NRRL 30616]|uniref:Uncharacterized protein n=1 Tax=Coniochaeta ligniaria NRRL 30616 TaxID=1408157 RepID=A0A1J7J0H4_9PEZI|nr:hypothetical protein CONLIGDRAFT_183612 [Coniochaeta ligniaria NRRL 30616]
MPCRGSALIPRLVRPVKIVRLRGLFEGFHDPKTLPSQLYQLHELPSADHWRESSSLPTLRALVLFQVQMWEKHMMFNAGLVFVIDLVGKTLCLPVACNPCDAMLSIPKYRPAHSTLNKLESSPDSVIISICCFSWRYQSRRGRRHDGAIFLACTRARNNLLEGRIGVSVVDIRGDREDQHQPTLTCIQSPA